MELKAAWILNNYPETRDSDIKLQLAYWREFEGYNGGAIYPEDLFLASPPWHERVPLFKMTSACSSQALKFASVGAS
jgi:hypothetical protein